MSNIPPIAALFIERQYIVSRNMDHHLPQEGPCVGWESDFQMKIDGEQCEKLLRNGGLPITFCHEMEYGVAYAVTNIISARNEVSAVMCVYYYKDSFWLNMLFNTALWNALMEEYNAETSSAESR